TEKKKGGPITINQKLAANAKKSGVLDCAVCSGLGFLYDPMGRGPATGSYVLCRCVASQSRAEAPPYFYFDAAANEMKPCPARDARLAVARIHSILRSSGIPDRFQFRFLSPIADSCLNDPELMKLVMAVDHVVDAVVRLGEGSVESLYLHGPTGCGKTMVACAALNEIVRLYQTPVKYAKITRDVLGKLRSSFNVNSEIYGEGRRIEEELASVPVLVIDDFGVHQETDWVAAVLYDLIDARYERNLLTIFTSNDPMISWKDVSRGRVYSRLVEMCSEIHVDAPDYRLRHKRTF
ncbi:MAG: ATP-binding protein, partial [Spirochaetia bacterium]|nr:ATP-binding protein [Spirochaetia bacterium]